jgi:hypothetical protein
MITEVQTLILLDSHACSRIYMMFVFLENDATRVQAWIGLFMASWLKTKETFLKGNDSLFT